MNYRSVVISKKGGPEVLQIIENEFRILGTEEVLIKIQACGVGGTDVHMRYWNYPGVPKIPFVPGYEIVGVVQDAGSNVKNFEVGDRVGALTTYGGYSEYIYLDCDNLVKVPQSVDSAEAAAIILNYTSAFQILKRVARVNEGDLVLITGASGGVGSALLDLGKLEKLNLYATASLRKHDALRQYGAILIDYKSQDFVEAIRKIKPGGLDFVFDGVGGPNIKKSFQVLHRGGTLIEYGYTLKSLSYFIGNMCSMLWGMPRGRNAKAYGISVNYRLNKKLVMADIVSLLSLLENGKVHPLIYKRMPILSASEANRLLESGEVTGNVVLVNQ